MRPPDDGANPLSDPAFVAGLRPIPTGPVAPAQRMPASDIVGERPSGEPVEILVGRFEGPLLLCFLHVNCDGCDEFWHRIGDGAADHGAADHAADGLPEGVAVVAVTKGPGSVDRAEVVRAARGVSRVPVVMSDQAWRDYRVSGYPFFVLVDATAGTVIGETVGFGWSDVQSMVRAATT
jgi:hypothetical protein